MWPALPDSPSSSSPSITSPPPTPVETTIERYERRLARRAERALGQRERARVTVDEDVETERVAQVDVEAGTRATAGC